MEIMQTLPEEAVMRPWLKVTRITHSCANRLLQMRILTDPWFDEKFG